MKATCSHGSRTRSRGRRRKILAEAKCCPKNREAFQSNWSTSCFAGIICDATLGRLTVPRRFRYLLERTTTYTSASIQLGSPVDSSLAAVSALRRDSRRWMTRVTTSGKSRAAGHGSSQAKTADADDQRNDRK
jgi:hypothetical protein